MPFFLIAVGVVVAAIVLALTFSRLRSPPPPNLSAEHIREALLRGDRLEAIRWYRMLHGVGLKRAKSEVAALAAEQPTLIDKHAPREARPTRN